MPIDWEEWEGGEFGYGWAMDTALSAVNEESWELDEDQDEDDDENDHTFTP